jgi:pimeloyl-ACP methyl ester carboxylesterase
MTSISAQDISYRNYLPAPGTGNRGGAGPRSFKIAVDDAALHDLKRRLDATRWPDEILDSNWAFGTNLQYLKGLVDYWRSEYDWRAQEAMLNRYRHYTAPIDQVDIHFIHEQGEGSAPVPLLLTHGWPGSTVEFHELIPLLTRPSAHGGNAQDAFTIIAPSIPGYGLSFRPYQRRFGLHEIADAFQRLMTEVLGYRSFVAHGHDWGAFVSTRLGYAYPDSVVGIHITLLAIRRERMAGHSPDADEKRFYEQLDRWLKEECGYSWIMGTKPQTLAYALTDSPVGLAAWIIEKFRSWSDCNGDLDAHFSRDVLLTNIMLYWVTGAIGASFWPYYARFREPWIVPHGQKVMVPTGYAEHPREILTPPRSLAELTYGNITRWTRMPSGGHFPALETPRQLAEEIRAFFRPLRSRFA